MHPFSRASALLTVALACQAAGAADIKILDGQPRTLIYTANSHHGGWFIDRKLNTYFNGHSPITVKGASGWGLGINDTGGVIQGGGGGGWLGGMDLSQETHPVVYIALAGSDVPLQDSADAANIQKSVGRLQEVLGLMRGHGVAVPFVSTYHYEQATVSQARADDEDIVYRALAKTADSLAAINVCQVTRQYWPLDVGDDLYHPSNAGTEIYSQLWFEALLRHDGLPVPDWSRKEMLDAIHAEDSLRHAITLSNPVGGQNYHIGDTLHIRFQADCSKTKTLSFSFSNSNAGSWQWLDSMSCTDPRWGDLRVYLADSLPNLDPWTGKVTGMQPVLNQGKVSPECRVKVESKDYHVGFQTTLVEPFTIYPRGVTVGVRGPAPRLAGTRSGPRSATPTWRRGGGSPGAVNPLGRAVAPASPRRPDFK